VKAKIRFPASGGLVPGRETAIALACDIDCAYTARLERLPKLSLVRLVRGRAVGGVKSRIVFPPLRLRPARYRFAIELLAPVNPGTPTLALGRPFQVRKAA
jgi:hypothetical protein